MATATQQPPAVPPRPSRSQEKTMPTVPARPVKGKIDRSVSPNPDRFALSPLNDSALLSKSPRSLRFGNGNGFGHNGDPIDRSKSVDLPSVGEEGMEYAGLASELSSGEQSSSPEQTRTIGDDLKLHAPKPSLPAVSAKQRVMAVTRTDSDKAASFGIGKPSSMDDSGAVLPSNRSLKKKASTTSQLSNTESHIDDEHGIPEIGKQVPMYPNAGDVQAPSPAPGQEGLQGKNHTRRKSARGNLPPGSYGLHGHGVVAQDKLEKAYYDKHPDLLKKEHTPHHHDRPYDFSMSREDLNKIVRDTASRGSGLAAKNYPGTPSDQIGWQAIEESTSRVTSPRPSSEEFRVPVKAKGPSSVADSEKSSHRGPEEGGVIHVDEPGRRRSVMFSDGEVSAAEEEEDRGYTAPILAEDELAKDPSSYDHQPAVELPVERRGSAELEPSSRPTSRPASLYKEPSFELRPTPLEDVEEYEPLFTEEEEKKQAAKLPTPEEKKTRPLGSRRFPSQDVWEDAPSSVHYTAEVSTPDIPEEESEEKLKRRSVPVPRDGETPAQAFARHQEELAEKEARERGPDGFLPMHNKQKPLWSQHQTHLVSEKASRPGMGQRFPSRDVWEDAPDSLQLETTVSTPQQDEEAPSPVVAKPEIPQRPSDKPSVPERPKARQGSGDESKPAIPDRPKPAIPARPAKAGPTSGGLEPAEAAAQPKPKPAVPARPVVGSKIAAMQAGFMNDLNNRLRLGPQAPVKKEEPAAAEEGLSEEKEKAPLSDARKGRARGPQRRAPAQSASPAPAKTEEPAKQLGFSMTLTVFEVDPEEGAVSVGKTGILEESEADAPAEESEAKSEEPAKEETKSLVTNMAGETILEEEVKKSSDESVEPVAVEEHGGEAK
ncbi:altered inheritance of mitochondria protein 21 [Diplogelasinospora grovesii]|uniref:Altered inheritance of mitochondria protein 21 n=1 Tax=Diplogelasinospora grovesii TaxID=303347 RepID=A0AAN6NGX7_9PEZI|nr:altered inheritance of mitochondria protein 21 [Diplogelasinospora grovesii]